MKWMSFGLVMVLNLAAMVGMDYILMATPYGKGGLQPLVYWGEEAALLCVFNLALAAVLLVMKNVRPELAPRWQGVPQALLIGAGLSVLLAFPVCYAVGRSSGHL